MSYEGYVQCICTNGHYFTADCYAESTCNCGAAAAIENQVDQTNGEDWGYIPPADWERFIISPAKSVTCDYGFIYVTEGARYRIPAEGELWPFRTYRDENDKLHLCSEFKEKF